MKIYHYPKCGKSREGMAILRSYTNEFETKLYMKEGLRKEEIEEILQKGDFDIMELIRTNEKYYKEHLKNLELSQQKGIEALLKEPRLLQRPIVVDDAKAVIGRPPEDIHNLFSA